MVLAGTDGLLLIGGTDGTRPVEHGLEVDVRQDRRAAEVDVQEPAQLFTPVTDASAAVVGSFVWVYGGTMADGTPTGDRPARRVRAPEQGDDSSSSSASRAGPINLPAPRTNIDGFAANGTLYAVGGSDGTTPQRTLYWGVPTSDGNIPEWKHLVVERPAAGQAAPAARSLILGPGRDHHRRHDDRAASSAGARAREHRAGRAVLPARPVRGDVPALKIDGEIGQQLGYLAANTVGIINFVILVLIGVAIRPPAAAPRVARSAPPREGAEGPRA